MIDAAASPFRPWTPPRRTRPMPFLPFLWQSWRDPLLIWSERHFTEPQLYGKGPMGAILVVSHPEGVRRVLTENAANYEKGDLQRRVLGPLLAEGLLLAEGEAWRRARRILAPLFTPARTQKTAARMAQVCAGRVKGWKLEYGARVLDIDHEMSGLTFDILSAALFSDELEGDARGFEQALNRYLRIGARIDPLDVINAPGWIPRLGRAASAGSARFFEDRVGRLVAARRKRMEAGETAPDDLLSALLSARDETDGAALTNREVAANILTFILAGHETTARTLGWALHLISRSPQTAARLKAEADAFDVSDPGWAAALPWTRAVIEEAMRLFPPAPTLMRRAVAADVIGGQAIEAGTTVIVSPWIIHRHETLWDDPNAFRPERFLPENRKAIDRYAYIPFSAGPRVCIGAAFAMQEAMIALATILRAAEVEAITPVEPRPTHQITLRSRAPMRLRLRARRNRAKAQSSAR
ncbi:cytochrome P450 [Brevundimonas naejangsanensis]|uniref:cytochrome P450 n=1 Tax=Brevundimonas naejangsanensis TaxID=588932 RepID=UPI001969070B|nr:cytochrome P450 [Brevundimonas naejangsanensis]